MDKKNDIARIINEAVGEYVDSYTDRHGRNVSINTPEDLEHGGMFTFSCTKARPEDFKKSSFSREFNKEKSGCAALGFGVYSRMNPFDAIRFERDYGHTVIKVWIPDFSRYMVNLNDGPGYLDMYRKIYGTDDPTEQYRVIFGDDWEHYYKINGDHPTSMCGEGKREYDITQHYNINGYIYRWDSVMTCLHKNYGRVYPYAWATRNDFDFDTRRVNWHPIRSQETLNQSLKAHDSYQVLGRKYLDFCELSNLSGSRTDTGAENYRSINGFMRVKRNFDKKYNYVWTEYLREPGEDVEFLVNNIWFNEADDFERLDMPDMDGCIGARVKFDGCDRLIPPELRQENGEYFNGGLMFIMKHDDGSLCGGFYPTPASYPNHPVAHLDSDYNLVSDPQENVAEGKGLFGNILTEAIEEYAPEFTRDSISKDNPDLYICYRLSDKVKDGIDIVSSICNNGFSNEFKGQNLETGKNMLNNSDRTVYLGWGVYGNQIPIGVRRAYGNIEWMYGIPKKFVEEHFLCANDKYRVGSGDKLSKYNIKENFNDQIKRFFPNEYDRWRHLGQLSHILDEGASGTEKILRLQNAVLTDDSRSFAGGHGKADAVMQKHGVGGYIYYGRQDGNCIFCYDTSMCIPLAYREVTNNKDEAGPWKRVKIYNQLWDKTFNGHDPVYFLKGTYMDYENGPNIRGDNDHKAAIYQNSRARVRFGFMPVRKYINGKPKWNFVKRDANDEPILLTDFWFDDVSEPEKFEFDINGNTETMIYSAVSSSQFARYYKDSDYLYLDLEYGDIFNSLSDLENSRLGELKDIVRCENYNFD